MEALDALKRETLSEGKIFIVKFGASWCRPCRRIKHAYEHWKDALQGQAVCIEIDIDSNIDVYSFYKRKRVVRGVPSILAWFPQGRGLEEICADPMPDDSVTGGSIENVNVFFTRVARGVGAQVYGTIVEDNYSDGRRIQPRP
jgi:thiol-disulfide isomerase/thioredoxin